ncbi:MAG: sugar phosphate nucleotidyltransferase [Acidobacteriota bacterium]|nr:sugar phosphate nucleotidyltransferase [Acidobacteriota bacterium]
MKVAIFVGGRGTRLFGDQAPMPKALFQVGDRPIIWHILRMYMAWDIREFVLLLGYRGDLIADYFVNHAAFIDADVRVSGGGSGAPEISILNSTRDEWHVTLCPTGVDTEKGDRLRVARQYLMDEPHFMATYGDGLSDVDLGALADFHGSHGKLATITTVRVHSQWGHVRSDDAGLVTALEEKPMLQSRINGGFFVFRREVLDLLEPGDPFETGLLPRLASMGELMSYEHDGFWTAMDTYKDNQVLNELWDAGVAPWKTWA